MNIFKPRLEERIKLYKKELKKMEQTKKIPNKEFLNILFSPAASDLSFKRKNKIRGWSGFNWFGCMVIPT